MAKYQLHLENRSFPHGDSSDQDLADDKAAISEAGAAAAELLRDELLAGMSLATVKVTVKDAAGRLVGTVNAHAVIELAD